MQEALVINSASSPIAVGKRELQKEARRNAIIDAALEEFTAQGFTSAKLDDVADRAGIGKGTIYLYFQSKESLFEEVVRKTLLPGRDIAQQNLANFSGSAEELLCEHFANVYSFMQNDKVPELMMMIMGETVRFPKLTEFFFNEMVKPSQAILSTILQRGIDSGEFRADALDIATQLLMAPAMNSVIWNLQFGGLAPLELNSYAKMHIDFMLRALRA
jgi:AcrR family transcriptional regulator